MKRCVYHVTNECRPGLLQNTARLCNLDAWVNAGKNAIQLVVLPIDREITPQDLKEFESILRSRGVHFEKKRTD